MWSPSLVRSKWRQLIGAHLIGDHHMRNTRRDWPRALSARRLVLLATVAGLGVASATIGPNALRQAGLTTYAAANAAEIAGRPAGFADLVEKVKPAVISVRVKVKAELPDDEFRRRYAISKKFTDGAVFPSLRNARFRNAQ